MKKNNSGPRLIFWELTKKCNLKCIHCRAEADESLFKGELETGEIKNIIDDISGRYSPILVLTGGEPLYRDDIFEIASHAHSRGLKVALATNGTMVNSNIASRIKSAGVSRVSISLDGSSAASHDSFRGVPGSFELALAGAANLAAEGVEFQFNMTMTKRNIAEMEDILALAKRHGASALHLFMLVPVGCGVEIAEAEMLSASEYEKALEKFYFLSKTAGIELKATCAPHYYRIIRQKAKEEGRTLTFETDGMSAVTRGCLAGTGVCFISNRAIVQPCGYLPVEAGDLRKNSFQEIWENSKLFSELRDFKLLGGKCGECEYKGFCGGCRARAYYERNSDYLAEEPYCVYEPEKKI